jgi:hypothetical protein
VARKDKQFGIFFPPDRFQPQAGLVIDEHPKVLTNGVWKFITGDLLTLLSTNLDDVVNTCESAKVR